MPIPVDKVIAVFDKLNVETEKRTYPIIIKDSKYLQDDSQAVNANANMDWEFFISVDPQKMK
ncbi:MAG: hypothetical protein ACRCXC_00575 [Legionella sp.]